MSELKPENLQIDLGSSVLTGTYDDFLAWQEEL